MAHHPEGFALPTPTDLPGEPAADIDIDPVLVHRLLRSQHPDLAHLPLRSLDYGWDNVMFRLGDRLSVRLPRRKAAAQLIEHEQTWLPQLAHRLPLPVSTPVRIGTPSPDYPWPWSIVPWINGHTADIAPPEPHQAERFAEFLRSLHQPAPNPAPVNPYRGVPLQQRAAATNQRMVGLAEKTTLLTPALIYTWQAALAAPMDGARRWIHGDLHARNVLVHKGAIAGIIDWGDITAGDVATDLASIWMLFPQASARQRAIAAYPPLSEATRLRAQGWAIFFGVTLLDTGLTNSPRHAAMGRQILEHLAADLQS